MLLEFEEDIVGTFDESALSSFAKKEKITCNDIVREKMNKINQISSHADAAYKAGDMEQCAVDYQSLLQSINSLYKEVSAKASDCLDKSFMEASSLVNASLDIKKDQIEIIFDSLPAKRSKHLKDNTHFTIFAFRKALDEAVSSYINRNENIKVFKDKKVVVHYSFMVNENEKYKDYDNYDVKGLNDWIAMYFLEDDSPYYTTQFFDSQKIKKPSYLRVRIVPEEQFKIK